METVDRRHSNRLKTWHNLLWDDRPDLNVLPGEQMIGLDQIAVRQLFIGTA